MVKVFDLPSFPTEGQLFHVPGSAFDGGLTSGGAQVIMPEPGGFSTLEIKPSLQDGEWDYPTLSWLMSKTNGQVIRTRLLTTPQISLHGTCVAPLPSVPWNNDQPWNNNQEWEGDFSGRFSKVAAKGAAQVEVDLTGVGPIVKPGHVIGHAYDCYMVDEVEYNGDVATITITPPLRRAVAVNDQCPLRPWFTGRIQAGSQFKALYNNLGHITPGTIILTEAIV